jgi:uncharacterized protein (UPF0248 family)
MKPLHELLNRIKWDAEFGNADFVLGYFDRFSPDLIMIPLGKAGFGEDKEDSFELTNEDGKQVNIPLHRVKQLYRNGELIWSREH